MIRSIFNRTRGGLVIAGQSGLQADEIPVRLTPASCRAIQQSDEMHCAICGLRWDVNDGDPPKCRRALR